MVPQLKQWTVSIFFFFWEGGCYPRGLLHHNLIGIENLLRRYDTIKTCRWNFFKFPWVIHNRKICKNQSKNKGSPYYKNEKKILFLFTFSVSFFMALHGQKLIYTINIWFSFVFGPFFEQVHLLNLIILGVYAKRLPKYARISL